jgi:hypothetical protein
MCYVRRALHDMMGKMVDIDGSFGGRLLRGLLKRWPTASSKKQQTLVSEAADIAMKVPVIEVPTFAAELVQRLCVCAKSSSFGVAASALQVLSTPRLTRWMLDEEDERMVHIREKVVGCAQLATDHWHVEPRYKAKVLLALLGDQECSSEEEEYSEEEEEEEEEEEDEEEGVSSGGDTSGDGGHGDGLDVMDYDDDDDDDDTELIDMI